MSIKAITNVNILTMNPKKEIFENGVVIIKDNLIVDVGHKTILKKYSVDQSIDGNDGILMPGMVNTHTHVSMVVFRSLADDVPDRLNRYLFPLEKELVDEELVYIGAQYGIAEMLLSGVTTFADMYYFENKVAEAAHTMGIRAILGETVIGSPSPDSSEPYGGLVYAESFIDKWKGHPLITPAIAPHAPYSSDSEHLVKASQMAKKYDVPMMMHVAEMTYETEKYKSEYNMTPVEYLDSIGVLNDKLIAAHLIHVTDDDLELLKRNNVGIAHNAGANTKAAKGVAPANKMYKMEMNIGLGTDGPMSGNTLDIITQLSLVAKIHKLSNHDRSMFPASEVVEMATLGGAKTLNLDHEIGSIEIGKKADLIILETESVNMQPIYDYYSVLTYSANPSNVETVIVDGEIVVENKKLKHHKLKEIQNKIADMKERISKVARQL